MLTRSQKNLATFILLDVRSKHIVYHYNMMEDRLYVIYDHLDNNPKTYDIFFYKDYVDKFRLSKLQKIKDKIK